MLWSPYPHARARSLTAVITVLAVGALLSSAHAVPDAELAGHPPFRRLFLDATVVERSAGLERVFHAAERHAGNPILVKDRPYEGWGPYLYGTVLKEGSRFRMWYQSIGYPGAAVLYAESDDGIRWRKPDLGAIACEGSTRNNIVAAEPCHIASVLAIPDPKSPEERWALYSYGGPAGPQVAYSPDGIHWRRPGAPRYEKLFTSADVVHFFYDPYRSRYVATYKTASRRHRAVGLATSSDGLTWTKPAQFAVFAADDLDPDATQIYGMPVFPYQGLYIGLPWIYHARYIKYGRYSPERMIEAQEGSDRTVDVQLAWSWDLSTWTRTPERRPFLALGKPGSFDARMVYTARAPVADGDRLLFYYGGFDRVHDDGAARGAIGLAILRLDGFCSMRAADREGWLITRREVFGTPSVTINARTLANGYVAAEILDRRDRVLPGFSRAECLPFSGDSMHHKLRWKSAAFPPGSMKQDRKIRFFVKNADLYSYLPSDVDMAMDGGFRDP